ncbi:MAG: GNAT family N-acetyltransferase [Euryarchaeota archaeon]|nr:GNAT family N-acetyltransferase [Euryarchaeota archaeon]
MLRYRLVEHTEEMETLREDWERVREACRGSVLTSFEWTLAWLESFRHVVSPRIVVVEEGGEVRGLAPFTISEQKVMGVIVRKLSIVGNGKGTVEMYDLSLLHEGDCLAVVKTIVSALDEVKWNMLNLENLRNDPSSLALFDLVSQRWLTDDLTRTPCPYVRLDSVDDVIRLIGKRTQRTIRKMASELQGEERLEFRIVEDPEGIVRSMETYVAQHRDRWSRKGGSIFSDDLVSRFMINIAERMASMGRGRCYEILIDGEVASQILCFDDRNCTRAYRVGVNDAFLDYSPGNLVTYRAMEDSKRRGFKYFDFAKGAEEFKYRMGAQDRHLVSIQAKRGSLRLMSKLASVPGVRKIAEKSGVKDSALKKLYE